MCIRDSLSTGDVGIGQTSPAYKLDVTGDINATGCLRSSVGVASGTCVSDERLKSEIETFDLGLEALLGIQPKYFKYNGLGGHPASDQPELGVIAQDVEKTAPELIKTRIVKLHPEDKKLTEIKQVNYTAFLYVVINSVKELYQNLVDVKTDLSTKADKMELASMRTENLEKDRRIQSLEQENAAIKSYLCSKDPSAPICK